MNFQNYFSDLVERVEGSGDDTEVKTTAAATTAAATTRKTHTTTTHTGETVESSGDARYKHFQNIFSLFRGGSSGLESIKFIYKANKQYDCLY